MLNLYNNFILTKNDLTKIYESGCKSREDFKVGIEYERLLINKGNHKAVSYYSKDGIYKLLRQIAYKHEWRYITDFGNVVGLEKGGTKITLEPGGQLELSMGPKKDIREIEKEIDKLDKIIVSTAKSLGITVLNYAISPLSTYREIDFIPKKRYAIMSKALPGDLSQNMMKECASIQVNLDYENEQDAMTKLRLALKLSPIVTAMFANSPLYNGSASEYKSYRSLVWLFTDNNRCGLICEKIFDDKYDFTFNDYVNVLLNVPMLYIVRNNEVIELKQKLTFDRFVQEGFEKYTATMDDFKLHASLYFPDARLNTYIETRNHDCQKGALKYSIPALYKGLFYNTTALSCTAEVLKQFSYQDFAYARESVPRYALRARLGKYFISDIAKEILDIAYTSLYKERKNEHKYLEPIKMLTLNSKCPADVILKNWNEKWNRNFAKFIQYATE